MLTAFQRLKSGMVEFFRTHKLRNELFRFCIVSTFIVCVAEAFYQWYAFDLYNKMLYDTTKRLSQNSAVYVERELENIRRLSYNIMASQAIQNLLSDMSETSEQFEKYKMMNQLMDDMNVYILNMRHIMCINFVSTSGDQSVRGPRQTMFSEELKETVCERAANANGECVLIPNNNMVILARQIRKIDRLDFSNLGVVAVQLDIKSLISDRDSHQQYDGGELFILENGKMIYTQGDMDISCLPYSDWQGENRYEITSIDGATAFITIWTSPSTGWTYITAAPYGQLFRQEQLLRMSLVLMMLVLMSVMAVVSITYSKRIVLPIEQLMERIKEVEQGKFTGKPESVSGSDEIAQLRRSFESMADELGFLITENYENKLVAKEFQYRALQAQINPHFLYNTLNTVKWLAEMNGEYRICTIVESLGNLLRGAIDNKEPTITIGEELNILESYTAIQKIRYEERLDIKLNVSPGAERYRIPRLTIQPIVENSITHAIDSIAGVCCINVDISEKAEWIDISVHDNGPGISPDILKRLRDGTYEGNGRGIGLNNIKKRLTIVFGEQSEMSITSQSTDGTTIRLHFQALEK